MSRVRVVTILTVKTEIPFDSAHYDSDTIDGAMQEERNRAEEDTFEDIMNKLERGEYHMVRQVSCVVEQSHEPNQ